jgi:hypothetical protein
VGKGRVGVLKVRDHDEPVVRVEVRDTPVLDDGREATHVVTENGEETAHAEEESVGDEDLLAVTGVEDERVGVEVVGPLGVPGGSSGVHEQVSGPAEKLRKAKERVRTETKDERKDSRTNLLNEEPSETVDGSVLEELVELKTLLNLALLASSLLGDLAELGSAGNEDLVAGSVTGGGVVLRVRDPPRVVGDHDEGVEEETHGVVNGLGRREGLVTALVTCSEGRGRRGSVRIVESAGRTVLVNCSTAPFLPSGTACAPPVPSPRPPFTTQLTNSAKHIIPFSRGKGKKAESQERLEKGQNRHLNGEETSNAPMIQTPV